SCSTVHADDAPKKVALLVGVNRYLKPGFDDLQFAEADVTAVGEELKKLGFQVTVLLGSAKEDSRKATKETIEAKTRELVKPLGKRDVMLLMFSGHGQTLNPDPNADPTKLDLDQFQSYYCPVNAVLNDASSQVALNYLLDDVLATNVGRKLLVLDACRDIPVDRGKGGRNARGIDATRIDLRAGTSVYLSCGFGQRSFEKPELGHGLFTHCLLDGLRGGAARGGELAWADLIAHVNRRMRSPEILDLMPTSERQVPFPAGDLTDTLLGRLEVRPTLPSTPELLTAPFSQSEARTARSAWAKSRGLTETVRNRAGGELLLIPPGEFLMGSTSSQVDQIAKLDSAFVRESADDEQPQHRVRITEPFYLGTYEVTKAEFAKFVAATGYKTEPERDGEGGYGWNGTTEKFEGRKPQYTWKSWGGNPSDHSPVVNVTWNDATAFCEWLSKEEGTTYRLPTEAEWEYACRAGTTSLWSHGDDPEGLALVGNIWDAAAKRKFQKYPQDIGIRADDGWEFTAPVGRFRANNFGLYDMHGNVWEWCGDRYDAEVYKSRSGTTSNPLVTV
ncbi:MAG: SUMF1/EgtB/PvdO family nonheme iron enzyme, partial [Planctomycetaceae bacterium]|nr:SUMF1/EgtB/PvdO family nonheme iron enzyme [Planctomycetaceae bacterium]